GVWGGGAWGAGGRRPGGAGKGGGRGSVSACTASSANPRCGAALTYGIVVVTKVVIGRLQPSVGGPSGRRAPCRDPLACARVSAAPMAGHHHDSEAAHDRILARALVCARANSSHPKIGIGKQKSGHYDGRW